jgi:ElaB/YqjD/DUF883 family membrane-anchored ribosome-binding protein
MVAKKKTTGKKTLKKKSIKVSEKPKLSSANEKRIRAALASIETKIVDNYKKAVLLSGKDWEKEKIKYAQAAKKDIEVAKAKIEKEIKNDPKKAVAIAAVVGALAGAVMTSCIRKKK